MTLRSKLIISYIVIIGVCLTLAFVILLLVARPLQKRLVSRQLTFQSQEAARQLNMLYAQGASTRQVITRFEALGNDERFRLVLLDARGIVLADNQGQWQGQQFAIPDGLNSTTPHTDVFKVPGGNAFIYALLPVGQQGTPANYVAAVAPQPSSLTGPLTGLGWGFIMAGLIAWLVSLVLGVLIARSIAQPLQQIAAAAGAVAAGDYEHRLDEGGPPEIKRVAASFNIMIEQVEAG
ncbi:MAG: HAMP domain-containing protein, partial [Chloroflexota bacterium]